jgi:hypothetical protein
VADDELDRMEGIINEECAPNSGEEAENEENEALERHRRSEAKANMFRADGDRRASFCSWSQAGANGTSTACFQTRRGIKLRAYDQR